MASAPDIQALADALTGVDRAAAYGLDVLESLKPILPEDTFAAVCEQMEVCPIHVCDLDTCRVKRADCIEVDGAPCCPDPDCPRDPCTFPGYADNH